VGSPAQHATPQLAPAARGNVKNRKMEPSDAEANRSYRQSRSLAAFFARIARPCHHARTVTS
jgi:hypothetical protein